MAPLTPTPSHPYQGICVLVLYYSEVLVYNLISLRQ